MSVRTLPELRGVIDQVDAQILQLLAERGRLAAEVGAVKRAADETNFYIPTGSRRFFAG